MPERNPGLKITNPQEYKRREFIKFALAFGGVLGSGITFAGLMKLLDKANLENKKHKPIPTKDQNPLLK